MTALAQRRGIQVSPWVVLLSGLCVVFGVTAGVSPKYAIAGALGLGFVVAVFANLTTGVALFVVLSFLDLLTVGGAAVSFMKVAGLLLFMSWVASQATGARRAVSSIVERHPAMIFSIVAFIGWNAISAAWALHASDALLTVYRDSLVLLLIPIMVSAVREPRHVRTIVGAFLIGAVFSAVFGILNPTSATAATAGRLSGGLGDPNEEASVLVAAIVLSVGMASVVKRSPWLALAAVIGAVIAFVGLVGTLSRGGLIAFACALVAGVIFGGRWRRSAAILLVVGVSAVVGYYAVLASGSAVSRVTSSQTSGRNDLWTVGVRMFEANPFGGVGAGNFQASSVHYLQRPGLVTAANYIVNTPLVAHNIYLEELSTVGIPGLLLMLGIFASGIAAALKAARIFERLGDRDLELMTRCVIMALIAFLSANFFISDLISKQLWLVFALCPAMLGLAQREEARAAGAGR
jgi:O-antigen ligase